MPCTMVCISAFTLQDFYKGVQHQALFYKTIYGIWGHNTSMTLRFTIGARAVIAILLNCKVYKVKNFVAKFSTECTFTKFATNYSLIRSTIQLIACR